MTTIVYFVRILRASSGVIERDIFCATEAKAEKVLSGVEAQMDASLFSASVVKVARDSLVPVAGAEPGLVLCEECGLPMSPVKMTGRSTTFQCSECGNTQKVLRQ